MNQEQIGKFISKVRKEKKLTQKELAEKLNVTDRAVGNWENGRRLPDYSIIKDLCAILDITINELFAGEYIDKKNISNQSEKNLLNTLKFLKTKMKKFRLGISLAIILLITSFIFLGRFILIQKGFIMDRNLKYTQIYISGEGNIKGDVNVIEFGKTNIDFDIGANKYGVAVFKDPKKALKRLKKDYAAGIKLIEKEYHLLPLSNLTYKLYGTYGWQVTTGTKEEQDQARFVSSFMDIYENSFNN